jgi:hypothetical protein
MTLKLRRDMDEPMRLWRTVTRLWRSTIKPWCRSIGPGIATFAAPLAAFYLVSQALLILLPAKWFETRTLSTLDISTLKLKGFARAVDAGMNFSIMSTAIWGASLVAGILSFIVMRRTLSKKQATFAWTAAALVGVLIAVCVERNPLGTECESSYGSATVDFDKKYGFRPVVIDNVICVAERSQSPDKRVLWKMQVMIIVNTVVGFIGAAVVMGAVGVLAMRYGNWTDVARLRGRLADFRTLTLMASVLFVLNALVTKALVSWAQGLLASEDDAASFARLGNALLNYWAAEASTVLIVALGLAAIFIQWDISSAAKLEQKRLGREVERRRAVESFSKHASITDTDDTKDTEDAETMAAAKWQKDNELIFDSATVVTATIGTIAPFLASPAVDLVTRVLH